MPGYFPGMEEPMLLVEVYIPAMDEHSDFMLDENAKVEQVIGELGEMLSKKLKSPAPGKEDRFMLCSLDKKEIFSGEKTLRECNVKDGSRLMLV